MSQILLVEDSKVQAIMCQRMLEGAGYSVHHVATAEDAVKACYDDPPKLVVLDQNLEEISGLEVCRRTKNDLSLASIPVLVLTASDKEKDHVAALNSGADAFLPKGSPGPEMLAVISRLMDSRLSVTPLPGDSSGESNSSHRTRILAIDDSPTYLEVLCKNLSNTGFDVTSASSAKEGLRLLDENSFDVAVVDIVMPEIDGFQFCEQARKWAADNETQLGLLVLTGSERQDVLVQSLESGADDYVSKLQDMEVMLAHTTALARRVARARQFESMQQQSVRHVGELREAELKRQQAEERAKLADELAVSNNALEQSNEQLKSFAYVASHDLQAPLRRVKTFCELLQSNYEGKLDDDADEYIGFIIQSTTGMQTLISDLLKYSRVETNDRPSESVDCNAILHEASSNLEILINEANADITRDNLPTLQAYRTQLIQLFQNLIANAINYRSENPAQVHVSAEEEDGGWKLSFRDNGIGIAIEHQEKIFQMFKRLHGDAERKGTGIGLATCRKIIDRHDGKIWVESEPGVGSTFFIKLPNKA